ncbi:MAG: HEAT repeat domain-containing protein [Planctomycetota bacterium]
MSPGGATGAPPETPDRPAISHGAADQDLLHWSHWWFLESARYMDLRTHVQGPPTTDGRSIATNAPMAPSRAFVYEAVMPRLLDILENERSDDIVASALVAAGRLTGPEDPLYGRILTATRMRVRSSSPRVFESAVLALGLIGTEAACDDLLEIVRNTAKGRRLRGTTTLRARTRAYAGHALGLAASDTTDLGLEQRIAARLIEVLEKEALGRYDLPVACVSSLGLVELSPKMHVPPADVRESAAADHVVSASTLSRYLERWAGINVEKTRRGAQASQAARPKTVIQSHAVIALARAARFADEASRIKATQQLVALAKDPATHVYVRTSSTIALGEIARGGTAPADRAARKFLLDVMQNGQPLEKRFSRIALASSAGRPGFGEEPYQGWRPVMSALTKSIAKSRSSDMAWTALSIGILEDSLGKAGIFTGRSASDALRSLAQKRRSDDDSAALALGLALATRSRDNTDSFGAGVIREFDATTTPYLRGHVSVALGLMDFKPSIPRLKNELKEATNQPIRLWSAAVGLVLMGEPVGAELVESLRKTKSSQARIAVAAALGQAGTFRAVMPLLDLAGEKTSPTPLRASAIDALGAVCDLSRLPWRDPIAHALPYFAATATLNGNGAGVIERPW